MLLKKRFFGKHDGLTVFLLAAGLALSVFLPVMIMTGGYQLFFGDFQLQQIPFYSEINRAIHSGEFFWNWNTDMGVNTVSSYSFYLLGSPFFLITLLFPHTWTVYLIAPLYCLKIGLAAMGAFFVIRKRVSNKYFAYTGGILYAFSGFQMFNLVFNHFHDVVAIFPFVILAFDACVEEGKRGWFGITVFLTALYSYFFLPGVAAFVIIYYILRLIGKDLKFSLKNFGRVALESVLGVAAAAVILVPTLVALADFPRANEAFSNSYYMWFFSATKRYFEIARGMIFPPEIPGDLNFFHRGSDSWIPNWTSTSARLPLFSVTGVWAYLRTKKEKKRDWLSMLLVLCCVCSFVPLFNAVFLLFKSNYYTRWWYMAILFMAMATAIALDRRDTNWKAGIKGTIIASAALALPVGLSGVVWVLINPANLEKVDGIGDVFKGLEQYPDRFWLYVFFLALCIAMVILVTRVMRPMYFRDLDSDAAGTSAAFEIGAKKTEKAEAEGKNAAALAAEGGAPSDEGAVEDGLPSETEGGKIPAASLDLRLRNDALTEGEPSLSLPPSSSASPQTPPPSSEGGKTDALQIEGGTSEAAPPRDDSADSEASGRRRFFRRGGKGQGFIVRWSSKKRYGIAVLALTCLFAFLAWTFYEQMGYSKAFSPDFYEKNYLYSYENIKLEGMENSRLENYDGVRNLSIFMHTPGLSSFHSVVPTSTIDFYDSLGIKRDVATAVPIEHGALRSLLSVRYLLDDDKQRSLFEDRGWLTYVGEIGAFDVWENNQFIPMGFCYDNAIPRSDYDALNNESKSHIMLAAMVVDDDRIDYFSRFMNTAPFYTLQYSELSHAANAEKRRATASKSWEFGKNSFTSVIDMERENYVFYSIPYDAGWTAYVDGVEAEIERVNVSFMAVLVGEGEHTVEFKYVSPGVVTGAKVSAAAAGVFIVYLAADALLSRRRRRRNGREDARVRVTAL
ncbi:MAG: YfhO family protein [Clostridia bacterium]|nr:YfhO family protein [Clostridia bacterium]